MVYTDLPDMDFIWQVNILHATESIGAIWCDYTERESSFIESVYQRGILEEQAFHCRLAVGNLPGAFGFALATGHCTRPPLTAATAGKSAA